MGVVPFSLGKYASATSTEHQPPLNALFINPIDPLDPKYYNLHKNTLVKCGHASFWN